MRGGGGIKKIVFVFVSTNSPCYENPKNAINKTKQGDKKQGKNKIKPKVGTISRKTSDSTDKFNGPNLLEIAATNALELLRGQNFEN
jgi:hypothetical protein